MKKTRRHYDEEFKKLAVDLATVKGSLTSTAEELGITPDILARWRRERLLQQENHSSRQQLSQEQQEIIRLKRELKEAQLERDIPKKGSRHLLQERRKVFRFIKAHATMFTVERMCKVLKVSRSGYYTWFKQKPSKRTQDNEYLLERIKAAFSASKKTYGSPRITQELLSQGIKVSRPRVARLMQKAHLRSLIKKKYVVTTTDANHTYPVAANHLNRNFNPSQPGKAWVSDLTYIPTGEGWIYLTIVMDLYDRKIIGWSLSQSMKAAETSIAAWQMAIKNRPLSENLIFHSDRGIQFACPAFTQLLEKHPLVLQSMSGKGNCWDNAVAESFFKSLKSELVYHQVFQTRAMAKQSVFEYIEIWYNRQRRHSGLGYLSPFEFNNGSLQNVA
ncbi:IS3 family transposase [Larkinella insperata]|uniref:IS3 family transposase n=1 Tax=Larkinella insperata TaxID=332158 RepID=A0ABW3Q5A7_9BACT